MTAHKETREAIHRKRIFSFVPCSLVIKPELSAHCEHSCHRLCNSTKWGPSISFCEHFLRTTVQSGPQSCGFADSKHSTEEVPLHASVTCAGCAKAGLTGFLTNRTDSCQIWVLFGWRKRRKIVSDIRKKIYTSDRQFCFSCISPSDSFSYLYWQIMSYNALISQGAPRPLTSDYWETSQELVSWPETLGPRKWTQFYVRRSSCSVCVLPKSVTPTGAEQTTNACEQVVSSESDRSFPPTVFPL